MYRARLESFASQQLLFQANICIESCAYFTRNIVYVYTYIFMLYTSIHILTFTKNDVTFYLYIWP